MAAEERLRSRDSMARPQAGAGGPQADRSVVASLGQIVLVQEPEFALGGLKVCPSRREVIAGNRREVLQPRIMQVLVALARRQGEVVPRDALIADCWAGNAVSDDAIHRCIARIRRLAETHGGFSLETVPRIGYVLEEIEPQRPGMLASAWRRATIAAIALGGGALLVAAGFVVARF